VKQFEWLPCSGCGEPTLSRLLWFALIRLLTTLGVGIAVGLSLRPYHVSFSVAFVLGGGAQIVNMFAHNALRKLWNKRPWFCTGCQKYGPERWAMARRLAIHRLAEQRENP
jgi:hypothetical protein